MKWITFLFLMIMSAAFSCPGYAQSTGDEFQKTVAAYQQAPDPSGAEKVIKLAQTMTPAPAVPEEARRHYVIAMTLLKDAKKVEDFGEAVGELKSALLIAPWWPEANLRLGMALESAEKYDEAQGALKFYLLTGPAGEAARAAQDEIYIIEAKQKKAEKESSLEVVAVQKQKTSGDWLKKLDGRRYTLRVPDPKGDVTAVIDIHGTEGIVGLIYGQNYYDASYRGYHENRRFEISGHEIITPIDINNPFLKGWKEDVFIFSEDGEKITTRRVAYDGERTESDFLLEK